MKKNALGLIALLVLIVFASGCTSNSGNNSTSNNTNSTTPTAAETPLLIDQKTTVQTDPTGETNKKFITSWKTYKYNPNYLKVYVTETDQTTNPPTKRSYYFILKKVSNTQLSETQPGYTQYYTTKLTAEQYYPTWVQKFNHD